LSSTIPRCATLVVRLGLLSCAATAQCTLQVYARCHHMQHMLPPGKIILPAAHFCRWSWGRVPNLALQEEMTFKGVVFNEMKGVYSSPDSVYYKAVQESLFPDNTYRCRFYWACAHIGHGGIGVSNL
jgi:hypothetical protein